MMMGMRCRNEFGMTGGKALIAQKMKRVRIRMSVVYIVGER